MLDENDILKIRQFLALDRTQITIALITMAAELLLKATNNRAFYNLVIKRPMQMLRHLVYQLRKLLQRLGALADATGVPDEEACESDEEACESAKPKKKRPKNRHKRI